MTKTFRNIMLGAAAALATFPVAAHAGSPDGKI